MPVGGFNLLSLSILFLGNRWVVSWEVALKHPVRHWSPSSRAASQAVHSLCLLTPPLLLLLRLRANLFKQQQQQQHRSAMTTRIATTDTALEATIVPLVLEDSPLPLGYPAKG